ncbi:MAG: ParB/RepB/Spo0J family partition protein, partial [bacterium]|nr:ParB/RepB/Spo0J family partition protein [bacterium]
ALEKAEAYKKLQDEFKFFQKDIAKLVGKSREAVANTLRLLDLPQEIKAGLREAKISEGHARAILAVQDPQKQINIFATVVRDGLNVRDVESLVQKINIWQPVRRHLSAASKEVKDLEGKIREIIGIKSLKLRIESGLPKLTIFFDSKKELDALLKKINPS